MMSAPQRGGLVAAGWATYALYYLGRANLSVAAPGLDGEAGFGPDDIGIFVASFFLAYSVMQVVVGHYADRIGSRWLVGLGLVGSGLMNLLFISSTSLTVAAVAWFLNGAFQGMRWPPLIAGVSRWVSGVRSAQVAAAFGTSYVAGTVLALGLGGVLIAWHGVSTVFVVAGVVLIVVGIAWWAGVRDPVHGSGRHSDVQGSISRALWLMPAAALSGVGWIALATWTPGYLMAAHGVSIANAGLITAAMAAVSLPVMLFVGLGFRSSHGKGSTGLAALVLFATAMLLAVIPISSALSGALVVLFVAAALVNASSSIVLGYLPRVSSPARVGLASGIFSLAFSFGGGAGALVVGRLINSDSWNSVFYLSAGTAALSAIWVLGWRTTLRVHSHGSETLGVEAI